jgi:hypothetical protein
VFALTFAFAICAATGLWFASTAPREAVGRLRKVHSVTVSAAACALAVYFWRAHWIGIRLWKW